MNKMGIWIDHKKAIVVSLDSGDGGDHKVDHVESGAESHYHFHGGAKSAGTSVAQSIVKEQTSEERRKHQYHDFYKKVMEICDKPGRLYIFGPAEAKLELKKEMDKVKESRVTIDAVEACDKLDEHEIIVKIKKHFHMPV
jgi:hypothetical protein